MTRLGRQVPVVALLAVLAVALFVGARDDGPPPTAAQRTTRIAKGVRCPTCDGLSAAESEAAASVAIRAEIRKQVDAGETDGQVRRFLVGRYPDILLKPSAGGVGALVWGLPVVVLVLAVAGLVFSFRRGRSRAAGDPSDDDRRLVAEALGR
ncbi:MAG: cytochrome c-type biogenesis protein [Acidimicrobiales bacterium]